MSAVADAAVVAFALWGAWQLVRLWDEWSHRRRERIASEYLRRLGDVHRRWHQ